MARKHSSPRSRIEAASQQSGTESIARACAELLDGESVDPELLIMLSGFDDFDRYPEYWTQVWAARGLLWAWDDVAIAALVRALSNPAWRVREMAAKVARRHSLDEALPALERMQDDPNPRVRTQALKSLAALTR